MTTRDTLAAQIADDIARTDLTTAIVEAINESISYYQAAPFWFTASRAETFATVADQKAYNSGDDAAIPNFYRIDNVWLEDTNEVYEIDYIDHAEWQSLQSVATSARPYSYSRLNETIYFYPTPNDAYTIRMIGHLKVAAPATGAEADNVWMTDAYQLIRARSVRNLYGRKLRNYEDARIWEYEEGLQAERLRVESNRRVGSGMIKAMAF